MMNKRQIYIVGLTTLIIIGLLALSPEARSHIRKAPLISQLFEHRAKVQTKVRLTLLNHYMPPFDGLAEFIQKKDRSNADLKNYITFYEKIVEYFPHISDAHGMLGFCYYHMGEKQKAISAYQAAIKINPRYFWFHHNLAMIYFENGQYDKAIPFLEQAIRLDPKITFRIIKLSKTYLPIALLSDVPDVKAKIYENFRQGYSNTYKTLILCYHHTKDFPTMFKRVEEARDNGVGDLDFIYYIAGLTAYELQRYDLALIYLGQSLELERNNENTLYHLALSWQAVGKEQKAQEIFDYIKKGDKYNGLSRFDNSKIHLEIF